MKFLTFTALLAAALFSAVVVVPFLPAAKSQTSLFAVEARLASSVPGQVVLYYDSGSGFNEGGVARVNIPRSATPISVRLPLPPGTYRAFRFDPIDREGTVLLESLRVVGASDRELRALPFSVLQPVQHIQPLRQRDGRLEITVTPGGNDPQFLLTFAPPLVIKATWRELLTGLAPRAGVIFAVLVALLFALDRSAALRAFLAARARALAARPARAVTLVAAFAVVVSAYPVVFLGKSYVSPNLGTILLYDAYPALPGYTSGETVDVKGSDVGAVMWSHLPLSMVQHRAYAQGELPLWNRYNSGGTPLLGQGQSMFGDPLHLLVVAANGTAWAWDLKYLLAKWLFAIALGLLVLRLTTSPQTTYSNPQTQDPRPENLLPSLPALLITLAAPFLGFFLYRLNHPAFFSLCYAPWALYCWIRVSQSASRRATALWSAGLILANLALMNSGTAKEAYMLLLSLNFSGALVLLFTAAPWRERLAKFATLAWAGVLFVLLTAPIWATFLNSLKNSYTGYNVATAFQIQPSLLLGAFDEIFYRPIMAEERLFNPSVNFAILLGLLYFLATLRHHFAHRTALALAVSSLLPLAIAFGLLPWAWLVQVPFLSNVAHLDNTFTCVLIVLWSVLAGVGFSTAFRRLGTPEGRADLISAGVLLFALVFVWIGYRQAVHRSVYGTNLTFTALKDAEVIPVSPFVWATLVVLLLAALVTAFVAHRAFARRTLSSAPALILALCAVVFLWRGALHASSVGFDTYTARPTVRANLHAKSDAMEFVRAAVKKEPARGFGLHGNFFPGWTAVYGLETIHGPDALVNPFMREMVTAFIANPAIERWWDWRIYVDIPNVPVARPLFDALNVRYYLDLASDQGALGQSLKLLKTADLDVYESPTAWPRAFFTDRLDTYDRPEEFVEKIRTGDGRPFAASQRADLTRTPSLLSVPRGLTDRTVTPATDYKLTENTTTFTVRAKSGGVVVLNEVFWPGDFRAEVNGQKVPVLRLNHAFKGVALAGPGDYRITFRYVPKNWPRNLALSTLGAALLGASLWLSLRKK